MNVVAGRAPLEGSFEQGLDGQLRRLVAITALLERWPTAAPSIYFAHTTLLALTLGMPTYEASPSSSMER